jgi:hypothetical protein
MDDGQVFTYIDTFFFFFNSGIMSCSEDTPIRLGSSTQAAGGDRCTGGWATHPGQREFENWRIHICSWNIMVAMAASLDQRSLGPTDIYYNCQRRQHLIRAEVRLCCRRQNVAGVNGEPGVPDTGSCGMKLTRAVALL